MAARKRKEFESFKAYRCTLKLEDIRLKRRLECNRVIYSHDIGTMIPYRIPVKQT